MNPHRYAAPWSNVYGLARTLLALTTLLTLLFNSPDTLFWPGTLRLSDVVQGWPHAYTFFGLLKNHVQLARWIAIGVLALVASGWRPRYTALPHAWITWSFMVSVVPADGGDQVASNLSLILLPLALTDSRRWHWDPPPHVSGTSMIALSRIGLAALLASRVQAAAIYFHAAVGKLDSPEWVNGTALYYWVLDTKIGLPTNYQDLAVAFFLPPAVSAVFTWGTILLEVLLFLSLAVAPNHWSRRPLFVVGLVFHVGNVIFFGLVSFFFSMAAALVLLLWPYSEPFSVIRSLEFAKRALNAFGFSSNKQTSSRPVETG